MPARRGSSDLTILIAAGILLSILAVVSFLIAPVDNSPGIPGSSYSPQPDGAKAAYLVLKELGHDVVRSFEPIATLRIDPAKTILLLANPREKPSAGDQRALRSFVETGGVVVAFGISAGPFLPGAALKPASTEAGPVRNFSAALAGSLTAGAAEISARRMPAPSVDSIYLAVYAADRDVAVLTGRFGEGRVIWCVDETPIQNDGIVRARNAVFLANAAGPAGARTILWDEHYHGERRSLWSYLAATPLPWAGAQLTLVVLAVLSSVSRRRGPLWPRTLEPRTSPLEFIDTMASLYERADDARAAIETSRARLRRRLARTSGLPSSSTDDQLIAAAAFRSGVDRDRTRNALAASADALRHGRVNTTDAVAVVAELQELGIRR